ncbi:unnamed protein product [Ostreobium quekettii]|uniref:Protein farnesyltransferase/geranylgeranyltransferase type-1 subunit alpha n=1 Tax=Ostreobium quekettii TaxID=121088 RepID=A0A8S1JD88_9CHLO|nr:unnamed protein product [Ostreobium quekettii]
MASGEDAADREVQFSAEALAEDAKNYHAWAHRQVFAARRGAWEEELAFVEGRLEEDLHNNSAWTQRFFVLKGRLEGRGDPGTLLAGELDYVLGKIRAAPHNAAAWRYLIGICNGRPLGGVFWRDPGRVFRFGAEVLAEWSSCVPALDGMAELYAALAGMARARGRGGRAAKAEEAAKRLWDRLEVCDPLRRRYWRERCRTLGQSCSGK